MTNALSTALLMKTATRKERICASAVVAAVLALGACDMTGGVPDVAGTYEGPVLMRFPDLDNLDVRGSARLSVVQDGSEVTIAGSLTLAGTTAEVPAFTGEVSATGFVTVTQSGVSGTASDTTCGTYRPVSSSLTFDGDEARLVENVSTTYCGNIHLSGTLTR